MTHPLIVQLRFARSEFLRALTGVDERDAQQRFHPMNCISWNVGHLAWQEQLNFLTRMQGLTPLSHLNTIAGYGSDATTPALAEMLSAWHQVTQSIDPFLDTLTSATIADVLHVDDQQRVYTPGVVIQRVIYHYWYHLGENMAIRQLLHHPDLPEFVGEIELEAPYQPH